MSDQDKHSDLASALFVAAASVIVIAFLRGWLWLSVVVAALVLAALVAEAEDGR